METSNPQTTRCDICRDKDDLPRPTNLFGRCPFCHGTGRIEKRGPRLEVVREDEVVTLTITCVSQYAAMELYDQVCAGGREGYIELELETRSATDAT